jgi:hypothetical protein
MSLSLSFPRRSLAAVAVPVPVVMFVALLLGLSGPVSLAGAVGNCPNEGFRIGPSAGLPDCRAYEMVSPPDKNGGEVDGGLVFGSMLASPEQASADGEALTYGSSTAFNGTEPASALVATQYVSTRTAEGWRTRAITPMQQIPTGLLLTISSSDPDFSLFQGFNESITDGFLLAWDPQPDPSAPARYFNPYLYEGMDSGYQLLSTVTPPVQPPGTTELERNGFGVLYAGMSADGQHVIFEANDKLTPEAIAGRVNLYEWSAGRPLELISILPEGTVDTAGAAAVAESEKTGMKFGSSVLAQSPFDFVSQYPFDFSGALSSDGRRAFWSGGEAGGYQIYMHELTESSARTIDVSATEKTGGSNAPAHYWTANPEGSLVYFTSSGRLTNDATAIEGSPDLYQYDVNTGELSDLSVDHNVSEAADVQGVLGIGESDGSRYVYFAADGSLAEGASTADCHVNGFHKEEGKCDLYVAQESGGTWTTSFIATLEGFEAESSDFAASPMERTSRVSPNGRLLAFQSAQSLTGYDNRPANGAPCPVPASIEGIETSANREHLRETGGGCIEVFEYDAQSGKLICASCDPDGLPPTGDSLIPESRHLVENVRGWESSTVQQRYLLDDGRLYFQSEDALLPEATNDKQNVYEYEPEGVGQCAGLGSGGCLYLISTGESSGNSYFVDASTDGRDVFVLSDQQLVSQDGDQASDVYDAREDGGFASVEPQPCSGEACKPAITPAPAIYGAPSSATFQGAGNIQPAPVPAAVKKKEKTKKKQSRKTKPKAKRKRKRTRKAMKSVARAQRGRR